MAVLDATPGGAASNSYVSVEDADTYFDDRFPSSDTWAALSDADKAKALMRATREIDQWRYKAHRYTSTQALEFPRTEQLAQDGIGVPKAVRDATCEQALGLAENRGTEGRTRIQSLAAQGITSFQTGDHTDQIKLANGAQHVLHPLAYRLMCRWLCNSGSIILDQEEAGDCGAWPLGN